MKCGGKLMKINKNFKNKYSICAILMIGLIVNLGLIATASAEVLFRDDFQGSLTWTTSDNSIYIKDNDFLYFGTDGSYNDWAEKTFSIDLSNDHNIIIEQRTKIESGGLNYRLPIQKIFFEDNEATDITYLIDDQYGWNFGGWTQNHDHGIPGTGYWTSATANYWAITKIIITPEKGELYVKPDDAERGWFSDQYYLVASKDWSHSRIDKIKFHQTWDSVNYIDYITITKELTDSESPLPESCQDIRDADSTAADGEYTIYPNGNTQVFDVYCNDMASTPSEYLELINTGDSHNFAQYTAGGASPGPNVKTSYQKIRLDPATLMVDIGDQTFATTTGFLYHSSATRGNIYPVSSMPYGVAYDCKSSSSKTGVANIDLSDTPFAVIDTFSVGGHNPAGTAIFSQDDQIVNLNGGGYCGGFMPSPGMNFPFNTVGGFRLELNYIGAELLDTDDDGLPDDWEINGIDIDGDGNIDLDLPSLDADPNHKDIFVELDYMEFHRPPSSVINNVTTAFIDAPVSNPDGSTGINLHVIIDDQVEHQNSLPIWSGFDAIKRNYSGTATDRADSNSDNILEAKRQVFHYALFIHNQNGTTSSGISDGIPANDFIVSLGSFGIDSSTGHRTGSNDQQEGTFMHELGHNLGLSHGGGDEINCKPNYLSIMSYSRQLSSYISDRPLDYSNEDISLNEFLLDERIGVPSSLNIKTVYGPPPMLLSRVGGPINWNRDGNIDSLIFPRAIHNLGFPGCTYSLPRVLDGYNDWDSLEYDFKTLPHFADGVHTDPSEIPEITIEIVREMRASHLQTLNNTIQNLPDTAFDKPKLAIQRKNTLYNKLLLDPDSVATFIQSDDLQNASDKLIHDIRGKMDGSIDGEPKNDWIVEPNAQEQLIEIIDNYVATLQKG